MSDDSGFATPFTERKDCTVFTLRSIIFGGKPILHVTHDREDGAWQFLGWENADESDVALVALAEILELDPTVKLLADLPLGWHAWRQNTANSWVREPLPENVE